MMKIITCSLLFTFFSFVISGQINSGNNKSIKEIKGINTHPVSLNKIQLAQSHTATGTENLDEMLEGLKARNTRKKVDTTLKIELSGMMDMPWAKDRIDFAHYDVPSSQIATVDENWFSRLTGNRDKSASYLWVIIGLIVLGILALMVVLIQVSKYKFRTAEKNVSKPHNSTKSHQVNSTLLHGKIKTEIKDYSIVSSFTTREKHACFLVLFLIVGSSESRFKDARNQIFNENIELFRISPIVFQDYINTAKPEVMISDLRRLSNEKKDYLIFMTYKILNSTGITDSDITNIEDLFLKFVGIEPVRLHSSLSELMGIKQQNVDEINRQQESLDFVKGLYDSLMKEADKI